MRSRAPLILQEVIGRFRLHGDQLSFKPEVMARESRRVQEKNGTISRAGWIRGRYLSLRLNARNPRVAPGEEDRQDPLHPAGLSGRTGARMPDQDHAPVSSVRPSSGKG